MASTAATDVSGALFVLVTTKLSTQGMMQAKQFVTCELTLNLSHTLHMQDRW